MLKTKIMFIALREIKIKEKYFIRTKEKVIIL